MSGTFESAQLAARQVSVPVTTVDSRQVGIATGFAALTAADVLDAGGSAAAAVQAARERAASSSSLFYVDTLEYLRRGGRIGAAAALFGGALAVKPLLTIADGRVSTLEKVRTSARALARLEDLAAERAGDLAVDVSVAHLADADRAGQLADPAARATGRQPRGPRGLVRRARRRPGRARRAGHARRLRGSAARLTERCAGDPSTSGAPGPFVHSAAGAAVAAGMTLLAVRGMRSKRHDSEHQEAVSRRLALLSAELAAVREPEAAAADPDEPWRAPPTHTRVRPDRLAPLEVPGPPESEPPGAVPEPGRHARRRGWAPRGLPGPVAIGPGQLAVVGLAVVVGLVVTTWWLVRADPHEVGPPTAPPAPRPRRW